MVHAFGSIEACLSLQKGRLSASPSSRRCSGAGVNRESFFEVKEKPPLSLFEGIEVKVWLAPPCVM